MPRGDGTGFRGYGPLSGRGRGYCAGYSRPGFMNRDFGYGPGYGFGPGGGGRGFGRRSWRGYGYGPMEPFYDYQEAYPTTAPKEMLELRAKALEQELEHLKNQIAELSKREDK